MSNVLSFKLNTVSEAPEVRETKDRPGTLSRIMLTMFRSYEHLDLNVDARPVVLTGNNGAGKTNLLEALSLLSPGRGLRGAKLSEMARRQKPEDLSSPVWALAARLRVDGGLRDLGTGQGFGAGERRQARIDGAECGLGDLSAEVRVLWLTPAMDRLFVEGPSGRRRFFDRLVLSLDPSHASRSAAYERAMRERNVLLRDGPADPSWLDALEAQMAVTGSAIATARMSALARLVDLPQRNNGFPRAAITVKGDLEDQLAAGASQGAIEADFASVLARQRPRDGAAGRTLSGPHLSDVLVTHVEAGRPAEQCSTGEQKALLLGLVLGQARLVAADALGKGPLLLLDEIAAHFDAERRAALFQEILGLGLQAWLTGTDAATFSMLGSGVQHFRVEPGEVRAA